MQVKILSQPVLNIDGLRWFLEQNNLSWTSFDDKMTHFDLGDLDGDYIPEFVSRLADNDWESTSKNHEYVASIVAQKLYPFLFSSYSIVVTDIDYAVLDSFRDLVNKYFKGNPVQIVSGALSSGYCVYCIGISLRTVRVLLDNNVDNDLFVHIVQALKSVAPSALSDVTIKCSGSRKILEKTIASGGNS